MRRAICSDATRAIEKLFSFRIKISVYCWVEQRRSRLSRFLVIYRPLRKTFPGDASEAESAIIDEHFEYLKNSLAQRRLLFAGRREDAVMGFAVIEAADEAAARRFMDADPAVTGGVFSAEVAPFRLALIADWIENA